MQAADALAMELTTHGVDVVFALASVHNLPILDALSKTDIRLVFGRHEQGVVHMADGYARVSGKVGVAITSTGPGAGNAMGALLEAFCASSKVLHLTGQIDRAFLDRQKGFLHEVPDQLGMLKTASRRAYRVMRPEDIGPLLQGCFRYWSNGRPGPISIEIPVDVQSATSERREAPSIEFAEPPFDAAGAHAAAQLMSDAARPLIWAGGGAIASGCSQFIREISEATGAAVVTSVNGRGSIAEDHPNCIGNFANLPKVREFISRADCVLALGTNFDALSTDYWRVQLPKRVIQVDVDAEEIGRNYAVTLGIVGDCAQVLRAMLPAVKRSSPPNHSYLAEIRAVRQGAVATVRERISEHEPIVSVLTETLPRNAVVVKDATIASYAWANRILTVFEPRCSLYSSLAAIGAALPLAIGASIAAPGRPVVVIAGDGGFVTTGFELLTAVQERLPISILVFNDGGYGVLREFQDELMNGRRTGVDLVVPDFAAFADACGAHGSRPIDIDQLRSNLQASILAQAPRLVEIDLRGVFPILHYAPLKPVQLEN